MRKLFLWIILGSLFFAYGERPDINLGDRIRDKINFVGVKGENYSLWIDESYCRIIIKEEGKSELVITGPSLKFNIAAGDFEAVKNTKITDMYYLLKREDVNSGLLKITEGYEDIPFNIEKYESYSKDTNISYKEKNFYLIPAYLMENFLVQTQPLLLMKINCPIMQKII